LEWKIDVADHTEFLELFLANEASLRSAVRILVRDRSELDDTFQTIALTLWRKFDSYDASRPFGAWARGVAVKEVLQARRESGRRPTPFSPEAVQAILEALDRQEATQKDTTGQFEALERCIEALPSRWRQLIDLRYADGLCLSDMATRINRTLAATQRDLSRARRQLAECVKQRVGITAETLQ
jgi:RNA polymerase sigma-70 factor, ECF subfamily